MAERVWSEKDLVRRANRRLAVLRHAEEISGNVAATCRCFGISRNIFYRWKPRWENEGLDGLKDRSSAPSHCPTITHPEVVEKIIHLRRALADVTPQRIDARALPAVTWTRLNQHYRPAVELARVILAGADTDLHSGSMRVPGLVFDMNTVFEHFVRNALRHELGLSEDEFPDSRNAPLPFDDARRLRIKPDLSIRRGGECRMVGEIKYRHDTGDGRATHLYQTLAYASAAGLPDATLIYADGPTETRTHWLPNANIRIHVRHLDLNLPRDELLGQVRLLADHLQTPALTGHGWTSTPFTDGSRK